MVGGDVRGRRRKKSWQKRKGCRRGSEKSCVLSWGSRRKISSLCARQHGRGETRRGEGKHKRPRQTFAPSLLPSFTPSSSNTEKKKIKQSHPLFSFIISHSLHHHLSFPSPSSLIPFIIISHSLHHHLSFPSPSSLIPLIIISHSLHHHLPFP